MKSFSLVAFLGLLLTGCSSCHSEPWGQSVCAPPTAERVRLAACRAATDVHTWAPAAGALLLGVANDWDEELSDWARRETPVFGSRQDATDGGVLARDISIAATALTILTVPSGEGSAWATNKAKGIPVQTAAGLAPLGITRYLKETTNRVRPNGRNDLSFPSTITSETAAYVALSRRNIASMPIQRPYRTGLDVGLTALTALTGWSRVENGAHYPSDVLAGAAIGNFTAILINDSFFGPRRRNFGVQVTPGRRGVDVGLGCSFEH